MHNQIKLGYEFGTGEEVHIPLSHTVFTGVTQLSGKTTGIESITGRTGKRAVIFITKPGEESFKEGTRIKPFYRERSDWEFIKGLIESVMGYRIRSQEQAKIIQLTRESGGNNLTEFKKKLDEKLKTTKSDYKLDIYTNLHAYLEKIIPKIYEMDYTKELSLVDGINVIDLEKFAENVEIQGLVIASVLDEVLVKYNDVIVVIPELWKFCPQDRGTPCKGSITSFARQGAARQNFLYFDSQELASTDKAPLKQCSTWIMGYQSERNEVKHTLDQLPVPKSKKPDVDKIMSLGTGEFFVATRDLVTKVFVQAFWVTDSDARDVALGKKTLKDLPPRPKVSPTFKEFIASKAEIRLAKELDNELEIPEHFENIEIALKTMTGEISDLYQNVAEIGKNQERIQANISDLYRSIRENGSSQGKISTELQENIIKLVLSKIPKSTGNGVVYTVTPLEKLNRDFLEEAKEKTLDAIANMTDEQKRMIKYLESKQKRIKTGELVEHCYFLALAGPNRTKIREIGNSLIGDGFVRYDKNNDVFYGELKKRIIDFIALHNGSETEADQVYNHIIFEMLGDKNESK